MPTWLGTTLIRYVLPGLIAVAGVVLILVGGEIAVGIGVTFLGVAVLVWLASAFARLSLHSEGEREAEERAREYYDRHGHWPDERPRRRG